MVNRPADLAAASEPPTINLLHSPYSFWHKRMADGFFSKDDLLCGEGGTSKPSAVQVIVSPIRQAVLYWYRLSITALSGQHSRRRACATLAPGSPNETVAKK